MGSQSESPRAAVCAPTMFAASAGAQMLRAGGNAVDAVIATAFASAVTDPQNCGLGGFGGHAVIYDSTSGSATAVDFRSVVPRRWAAGERSDGQGALVAPPNVLPAMLTMHDRWGALTRETVMAPAVSLAANGFPVMKDLGAALESRYRDLPQGAQEILGQGGYPLREGDVLVQSRLAETLTEVSKSSEWWRHVESAVIETVRQHGGFLEPEDFGALRQDVGPASALPLDGAQVYASAPDVSGAGIVLDALRVLQESGGVRGRSDQDAVSALWTAWSRRREQPPIASNEALTCTTHLSVADARGLVVSLTFTHGLHWFGAGLIAGDTGVFLNAGAPSYGETASGNPVFVTNMAPLVCHDGARGVVALGSPGGQRIPSIVLGILLRVLNGAALTTALAAPRIIAAPRGGLEGESASPPLSLRKGQSYETLTPEVFYGPASCIRRAPSGCIEASTDPRFPSAAVTEVC